MSIEEEEDLTRDIEIHSMVVQAGTTAAGIPDPLLGVEDRRAVNHVMHVEGDMHVGADKRREEDMHVEADMRREVDMQNHEEDSRDGVVDSMGIELDRKDGLDRVIDRMSSYHFHRCPEVCRE